MHSKLTGRGEEAPRPHPYGRWWRGSIHWRLLGEDGAEGALVLIDGRIVRLNRVAAAVWVLVEECGDPERIFAHLRRRYHGVTDRTLRADLDAMLQRWRASRWIEQPADPLFPLAGDG